MRRPRPRSCRPSCSRSTSRPATPSPPPASGSRRPRRPGACGSTTSTRPARTTIPRGSVVSTGSGVRFRTDRAVTVPPAELVGLTIVPSAARRSTVTAVDAGPEGNVEPRRHHDGAARRGAVLPQGDQSGGDDRWQADRVPARPAGGRRRGDRGPDRPAQRSIRRAPGRSGPPRRCGHGLPRDQDTRSPGLRRRPGQPRRPGGRDLRPVRDRVRDRRGRGHVARPGRGRGPHRLERRPGLRAHQRTRGRSCRRPPRSPVGSSPSRSWSPRARSCCSIRTRSRPRSWASRSNRRARSSTPTASPS